MSDKPVFEGLDKQEAIFAPEELPHGADKHAADLGQGRRDDDTPLVPGAAVGVGTAGMGPASGAYPLSGIVPLGGGLPTATAADDAEIVSERNENES